MGMRLDRFTPFLEAIKEGDLDKATEATQEWPKCDYADCEKPAPLNCSHGDFCSSTHEMFARW